MSIRIAVDPTNPGQFFACCGLLELADRLWSGMRQEGDCRSVLKGTVPSLLID